MKKKKIGLWGAESIYPPRHVPDCISTVHLHLHPTATSSLSDLTFQLPRSVWVNKFGNQRETGQARPDTNNILVSRSAVAVLVRPWRRWLWQWRARRGEVAGGRCGGRWKIWCAKQIVWFWFMLCPPSLKFLLRVCFPPLYAHRNTHWCVWCIDGLIGTDLGKLI